MKQRPDSERRLRQADRLARVLRVLQLLQSRGRYNARTIADEQECTERTVYRDLEVLALAGVPWYYDSEERCYRLRSQFHFPALDLTTDELIGQATAAVITKAPGLNVSLGARPTTRKLATASSEAMNKLLEDVQRLVSVLDLKLANHSRHKQAIRETQRALLLRRQLVGSYASPYEPRQRRLVLTPVRLCLVKTAWYLIARPNPAEPPQTYRIARFRSLRMTSRPADVPQDFDLQAYFGNAWAVYRGNQSFDIELAFSKEAAVTVAETVWHHTQQIRRHKVGAVIVTFRVDGLNEIVRWVLGWAGRVKVIQPPELRAKVVERWHKAMTMNGA